MDRNKVQEALKPITDGLFGKQRPVRYERPHFKVRPLVRMLQDLTSIPASTLTTGASTIQKTTLH